MSRNIYDCKIKCDADIANNFIKNFLKQNGFILISNEEGEIYKVGNNLKELERRFKYNINDQNVHIEAWYSIMGKEYDFGEQSADINLKMTAISINQMLKQLVDIDQNDNLPLNAENKNYSESIKSNQNINYEIKDAKNQIEKNKIHAVNFAFYISIMLVILAPIGSSVDYVLTICIYSLAILGLKTPKRKKAIITIILTTISLLLSLFK